MEKPREGHSQRIVSAVRRIAKTVQQEDGRLGPSSPKPKIEGGTGVAFFNSNGEIESGTGGVPPDAETENPDKDGDGSRTKGRDGQLITDDFEEGDLADEFEAYDCTTGQKITLDLAPVPGEEFPVPDGWEGHDQPPGGGLEDDGTWEQGYYYSLYGGAWPAATMSGVAERLTAVVGTRRYFVSSATHLGFENLADNSIYHDTTVVYKAACGGSDASYCTVTPSPTEWPSDQIADLVLKDGKFTASEYDPDADQVYKDNPPEQIEVCDGLGNRFQISATADGRAMITRLGANGSVDELGKSVVVGRDGRVADVISNKVRDGLL